MNHVVESEDLAQGQKRIRRYTLKGKAHDIANGWKPSGSWLVFRLEREGAPALAFGAIADQLHVHLDDGMRVTLWGRFEHFLMPGENGAVTRFERFRVLALPLPREADGDLLDTAEELNEHDLPLLAYAEASAKPQPRPVASEDFWPPLPPNWILQMGSQISFAIHLHRSGDACSGDEQG